MVLSMLKNERSKQILQQLLCDGEVQACERLYQLRSISFLLGARNVDGPTLAEPRRAAGNH